MSTVAVDRVPAEDMQRALRDSGLSVQMAARRFGYTCPPQGSRRAPRGDGARLKRKLGLLPYRTRGFSSYVSQVPYEDAVKMVRAWNLDPVDYGL